MGEPVRVSDLRWPQFTDVQREALAAGERRRVELTVEAVLAAAAQQAGLDDFGPDDFHERLALWLDEVDRDAERTGLGRATTFDDCVQQAVDRLRIADLFSRHPEIAEVPIPAPVVVVGLPRSGTTHLVNVLAADSRFRSLPLWESVEPVPDPAERPTADGVDPRWLRAQAGWESMQATLPLMAIMHPMTPDHIHEELELQVPDFSSYSQEWKARCPRWRDYYLAHDQTPHYAYMKRVLQILQWFSPAERWVLKCPQHLEQLGPLLATFPDATLVFTHRDPVSVVQSAATMLAYVARMNYRTTEPDWYLAYWVDRIRGLLAASLRDQALVSPTRRVDVFFHDLIADEFGVVEQIYRVAGMSMTTQARADLSARKARRHSDEARRIAYDLRRDFGVEPEEVRAGFGFYLDAVPVRVEVT